MTHLTRTRTRVLTSLAAVATLSLAGCSDDPTYLLPVNDAGVDTALDTTFDADDADAAPDVPVDTGSHCTDGEQNADEEGVDCGGSCEPCPEVCGDGDVGEGETCDDGNVIDGDGCSSMCTPEFALDAVRFGREPLDGFEVFVDADFATEADATFELACEVCVAAVVVLIDGEPTTCNGFSSDGDGVVTGRDSHRMLETGTYEAEAAFVFFDRQDTVSCFDALEAAGDPDRLVQRQSLGAFEVTELPDAFSIQLVANRMCVDVPSSSLDDGVETILFGCTDNPNQAFALEEGIFRALHSGKCLVVDDTRIEAAADRIVQYECGVGGLGGVTFERVAGGYRLSTQAGTCWRQSDDSNALLHSACADEADADEVFRLVPYEVVAPVVAVGDRRDGGVVGYIFEPGDTGYVVGETRGLVVADDIIADVTWIGSGFNLGVATDTAIGTGAANTAAIVAAYDAQGFTNYAAKVAAQYGLGGTYSDWYLPSRDELVVLWENRARIGGFPGSGTLWTSSNASDPEAWRVDFGSGNPFTSSKLAESRVRPVRTFVAAP